MDKAQEENEANRKLMDCKEIAPKFRSRKGVREQAETKTGCTITRSVL